MLIGIDGNEANEVRSDLGTRAGVNVYAHELLKAIYILQDEWKDRFSIVVYLKNKPVEDLPKETPNFKYKVLPGGGKWILTKLTPYLFRVRGEARPDVLLSPSHYSPPMTPMPKVCSIMDLSYLDNSAQLKKKDLWQLKYWTAISVLGSKAILAISESTRDALYKHYPKVKGKVEVTYLGYDHSLFNKGVSNKGAKAIEALKRKYSIGSSYVLYLGVLKPSKNISGLVGAWSKIVDAYPEISLVIGGKKGWMFQEIFDAVKKLGLEKHIVFTDYVPEHEKPLLIAGAKLFVLPSFWEGFGHDVLHALACGVPVVASDRGAIPEVGGKAALYFDPSNPSSIADKISEVLSMSKVDYNKMVTRSLDQASKFSWEDTARKTLETLEKIK